MAQEIPMYRIVENRAASGKDYQGRKPLVVRLKKIPSIIALTPAASIRPRVKTHPAVSVSASKTAPVGSGRRGSAEMKQDIAEGPAGLMMRETLQAKLARVQKKINAEKKPSKAAQKCSSKLPFRKMVAKNDINRFVAV